MAGGAGRETDSFRTAGASPRRRFAALPRPSNFCGPTQPCAAAGRIHRASAEDVSRSRHVAIVSLRPLLQVQAAAPPGRCAYSHCPRTIKPADILMLIRSRLALTDCNSALRTRTNAGQKLLFNASNHPTHGERFWIRYTIFSPSQRPRDAIGELSVLCEFEQARVVTYVAKREGPSPSILRSEPARGANTL